METFKKLLMFIQTKLKEAYDGSAELNDLFADTGWVDIVVYSPDFRTIKLGRYRKKNGIVTICMQSEGVEYKLETSHITPVFTLPVRYRPAERFLFSFNAGDVEDISMVGQGRIETSGNVYVAARKSTDVWSCCVSFPVKGAYQ